MLDLSGTYWYVLLIAALLAAIRSYSTPSRP